ncbi:hypothetical protein BGX28_008736 [Mortierella sp. GBA30]|nr:hypothetical protein BGX28_008736 [Mortierella sp. GBA30]
MKHAFELPRTTPTLTGRVSFECERIDEGRPTSLPSHLSPVSVSATTESSEVEILSTSAPSSYVSHYTPFSAFGDDDDVNNAAVIPKRSKSYSKGQSKRAVYAQGRQEHQEERWAPFRDNHETQSEKVTQTELSTPVQNEGQDARALLVSRRASSSSAPTGAFVTIDTCTTEPTTTTTTIRAQLNNKTTARFSEPGLMSSCSVSRAQRRHSSEDGLINTRFLAMCLSRSQQQPPIDDDFAIPSKCRMVFHMRDEVSKVKEQQQVPGGGTEEDKTGLSAKKNFRPLQQPRQKRYSEMMHSRRQAEGEEMGLKKSASTKCAKSVSFKEPEPWKACSTAAAIDSTTTASTQQGAVDVKAKKRDPSVILSEPISLCPSLWEQQPSPEVSATPSGRLATAPLTQPSSGSKKATNDSNARPSSAPAAYNSSKTKTPSVSLQGHQRNVSAPSSAPSLSSTPPSSSAISTRDDSKGRMTTPPSSGNKFSRLWKSLAQRYIHHHHQQQQQEQQQQQYPHHPGVVRMHISEGPGGLIRRGSDLEPLVSVGRD